MNDHISRQAMLTDLKAKQESMKEMQLHDNAKIAERMISYVEGFPAAEKPGERRGHWLYDCTGPWGSLEIYCPWCGKPALYPEEEDRPLETPFCPHCGVIMDESVPFDPSWPFAKMSLKRMQSKKQEV